MKEKVWIVSELYYPEGGATGFFLTNIAEGLAKSFRVYALCGQPTYSAHGQKALVQEYHNGVLIQRCFSTTFNKNHLAQRTLNLITLTISIFGKALRQIQRGDFVVVVTNPPSLPFAVALACRVKRARCILLIHDVYPEVLVAAHLIAAGSPIARLLEAITKKLYLNVEKIIAIGRDMRDLVNAKLDHIKRDIVVIPNWGDTDNIVPLNRKENEILKNLGIQEKFVVQYSGNMGRTHGLELLLESVVELRTSESIHFVVIGTGAKKEWVEQKVRQAGLTNITLLPSQPQSELGVSLNACDIAIISFVPNMSGVSVPSRMYNVMAAGKPIIAVADPDSELARVIKEEGLGWVIPPGSSKAVSSLLLSVSRRPADLLEMGMRARRAVLEKYTLRHAIAAYEKVLTRMTVDPLSV
jgi:colanic acid biosynthesis glycosyl transferase WcaI